MVYLESRNYHFEDNNMKGVFGVNSIMTQKKKVYWSKHT